MVMDMNMGMGMARMTLSNPLNLMTVSMHTLASFFKWGAILITSLAIAWLAVIVGLGNIARSSPPEVFASIVLSDARLMGRKAELILTSSQDAGAVATAVQLARASLKQDPTVVSAIRTLAAAQELGGDQSATLKLMRYSEKISRRDFPTHFWLIDFEAKQNNVVRALDHYDAALRTSSAAEPILLPILLDAFGSTDLSAPLADILSRKPAWAATFVSRAISNTKSTEKLLELAFLLRERGFEIDPEPFQVLMNRAVNDELYNGALRLSQRPAQSAGVYNAQFDNEPKYEPFDWALTADEDLGSERVPEENNATQHLLSLYGAGGRSGIVAKQLLLLPPGAYGFRAMVSEVPQALQDRPYITINCAGEDGPVITTTDFPASSNTPNALNVAVEVPLQKCRAQWLYISVRGSNRIGGTQSSIHNVSIRPSPLSD